jgi:hypothetical protein
MDGRVNPQVWCSGARPIGRAVEGVRSPAMRRAPRVIQGIIFRRPYVEDLAGWPVGAARLVTLVPFSSRD